MAGSLHGGERFRTRGAWEEDSQFIVLLRPRFGKGRFGEMMQRWLRSRPFRIRLDDVGSFIWRRLDGRHSVAEIADELDVEFGARVKPADVRLATFLHQLRGSGWIGEDSPSRGGDGTSGLESPDAGE